MEAEYFLIGTPNRYPQVEFDHELPFIKTICLVQNHERVNLLQNFISIFENGFSTRTEVTAVLKHLKL
jgi:hypothetical protein